MAINFHRKLHWQVFIMKLSQEKTISFSLSGADNTNCRWGMKMGKKCIHLCNLPSATIYFFRVTRFVLHVERFQRRNKKKVLFFFSSTDYILFRFGAFFCFPEHSRAAGRRRKKIKESSTFSLANCFIVSNALNLWGKTFGGIWIDGTINLENFLEILKNFK